MEMEKKVILISGATSGIGKATAEKFAGKEFRLILTGRRKDRLESLQKKLQAKDTETKILVFDIRNYDETLQAIDSLEVRWKDIDILVNNAGLSAGLEPIHEGLLDDWERMIDTNVKGLLYLTRCVSPLMVKRKQGLIINIGSIAGKEVYPNGNVYCSTKHAVDALTKAMRTDLLKEGIRVSQVAPGAVDTEFSIVRFHGDKKKARNVYKGYQPLLAEDIAEAVFFVASRPQHVNINDILIMPTAQANATTFDRKD